MLRMRLMETFESHGRLCASHPWEMIIGTMAMAVSVLSMGLLTHEEDPVPSAGLAKPGVFHASQDGNLDLLILTITRCAAIIYVYLQFRKLRILGSKYLLGISGVFTIFSSFVFSLAVINMVGYDLQGFNEALPFFLLLVDLSRACALAKFALSAKSPGEVANNIGHGMAILGPVVALDTLVGTLVIGIGTLSGLPKLETMCCFGCLSVVANFLAFMTFYPASLAIGMEMLGGKNRESALKHFSKVTKLLEEYENKSKSNPVTNRVKLIMSAGLLMVHVNSRISAVNDPDSLNLAREHAPGYENADLPYWRYAAQKLYTPGVDYTITACVAVLLLGKYILFDSAIDKELKEFDEEFKDLKEARKQKELNEAQSKISWNRNSSLSSHLTEAIASETQETLCTAENLTFTENGTLKRDMDSSQMFERQTRPAFEANSRGSPQQVAKFTIGGDCDAQLFDKNQLKDAITQTDEASLELKRQDISPSEPRALEECVRVLNSEDGPAELKDSEIIQLVKSRHIPSYKLETMLGDHERGVVIRRKMLSPGLPCESALQNLPYTEYDYKYVSGACCENVIGYMPVPVGVAGPLLLDGKHFQVPMATTEGCLVASTNRGCRALDGGGGVSSSVVGNGMSRAPVVRFPTAGRASQAKLWLEDIDNFVLVKESFDATSRFARLRKIHVVQAARTLYIRFVAVTGDAMGMNMLSKGAEKALNKLQEHFSDMQIMSLSGNFCTDKKPSAINWIEGRGKSVVCEAVIPAAIVKNTLKTSVAALVDLNINKNLVGSAMAGSIGGFNAHAANIVTAIYIATGQDPAQNIASSNCMTLMEAVGETGEDLYISCTMPSIEVGTVGGGTVLPPQAACLKMLGVQGAKHDNPGENASTLARIVCATVMAGELSLMSALAAGHLVKSHLTHNRSTLNVINIATQRKSMP